MVAIEFDHRLNEHQRAARLLYQKTSWFARTNKVVAVVMAIAGLAALLLSGPWWTVILLVLSPFEWFSALSIEPLIVRYVFKKTPKFHERTTLTFSADRIHYKTPSIDSTIDWSLFSRLIEDDELFVLLYNAPRTYAIIPKRAFPSEAARAELRELARQKLWRAAA